MALGLTLLATGCAGSRCDRSTEGSIDDSATTSRVKSAWGGDALYSYQDMNVTAFKGHMPLSGFVQSKEQPY
ncbi:MAG: hypothetical protein HYR88_06765 [Verrucomicrobia bacterium]|nr:hypothetical protein [Verrucomicrobiota bacterium]MBI3867249.1 hypothetical protein [Verrucomicrobiota bacterium]